MFICHLTDMFSNMSTDNFEEDDSTDWLSTPLKCLYPVDAAMRCQVCKDFYKTPMITSCSHTFCSICIRRCLSNDGRCPACRTEEQELKLRNNGAMEDLVEAFKNARTEILYFAKTVSTISSPTSPLLKRKSSNESLQDHNSPKKRTSYPRQCSKSDDVIILNDADDRSYIKGHTLVRCPICDFKLPQSQVNAHLDRNCREEPTSVRLSFDRKGSKSSKTSNAKTIDKPIRRPNRLPNINYSLFKDIQLRKKLSEHGLSQSGTRLAMQKRYTEWITLWNANCDATHPKPPRELKSELERWERIQEGRIPGPSATQINGPKIKEKDFDGKAWSNSHDVSFKQLILSARLKANNPQSTGTPPMPQTISLENNISLAESCDPSRSPDGIMTHNNIHQ